MKYTIILLFSLVISTIVGTMLFILGCIVRFQQTMLLNKYIAGLATKAIYEACMGDPNEMNLCPSRTTFNSIYVGDWANYLGALIILPGFFIILYTLVGAVGVIKKSQALLLMMFILILTSMALEYYLLDIILSEGSFHEDAKDELSEMITSDYTLKGDSNEFTRMLNAIMIQAGCCGINGPNDFNINETFMVQGQRLVVHTPPACCDVEGFLTIPDGYMDLIQCANDPSSTKAFQLGCYSVLHAHFYETYGVLTIAFIMIVIVWEGIQGLTIFMIILRPAPKSPRKSVASSAGSARGVPPPSHEVPKKKFIPYSKVSSNVAADINRIKSTEIW
ncbi:hypothetical protein RRG08_059902 [Elysia crispata]|uniref:Tetraspanin n=1 Tax=Elysia crispata TaxID=231223 RepID=A0AAE0Y6I9_9GAST|nr:hypothetical protein RRG08_059902 [Elysia crispata]